VVEGAEGDHAAALPVDTYERLRVEHYRRAAA
jgi:hypothetical protein